MPINSLKLKQWDLHVKSLCAIRGIKISNTRFPRENWAVENGKEIGIASIKSGIAYASALHEIGHCLIPFFECTFTSELKAWQWAKKNALDWNCQMSHAAEMDLKFYSKTDLENEIQIKEIKRLLET